MTEGDRHQLPGVLYNSWRGKENVPGAAKRKIQIAFSYKPKSSDMKSCDHIILTGQWYKPKSSGMKSCDHIILTGQWYKPKSSDTKSCDHIIVIGQLF